MFTNNGEILLANLYCDAEEIALYSVPMSLSKISVYLIATPLATMLLPKLSSIRNDSYRQIKLFGKFELITLFVSLVYGMAFCVGGKGIIYLLYGDKYSGSVRYLVPTMLFSIILGLFHVCNQYMMTNDMMKSFTVAIMVFGLIAVTIIIKIKCKIEYIPLIMSMAMILACTLTIISKYRIKNKKRTDNQ
jgi:O-antigen/teichoic acid export membrane protein